MQTHTNPPSAKRGGTNSRRSRSAINAGAVPPALENFDSLPDSANVRAPTVAVLLGCSINTVWRMARAGKLKPRRLATRCTCFNVGELRALMHGEQGADA